MRLEVENVEVTLAARTVLRAVSLTVEAGEVVGLLGPNGAGKSTLMRAIAGHVPFAGAIRFDETPAAAIGHEARARLVAYLPQERIIGWRLRVRDVVGLGRLPWRRFATASTAADRAACDRAMDLMQISALADRPATDLSGGEQARVLAARAVAQDTPLLITDEPASGLDPAHQMTMMQAFRRLAATDGRSILVSLHDLTLAARWCDRLVVLKEGSIAAQGAPATVMTSDNLAGIYGVNAHIGHDDCGLIVAPTGLSNLESAADRVK